MLILVSCNNCGKNIEVTPSRFKTRNFFYCNKKCESNYKKSNFNVNCKICGKKFHVKPYRLKRLKEKENICCSKECSNKLKQQIFLKDLNHQYGLKGELNKSFKKDYRISEYGYLFIRMINHPFNNNNDFILFHRIIMEEFLRNNYPDSPFLIEINNLLYLNPKICIHHKNNNKLDNRISNLECMTLNDHTRYHNKIGKKIKKENKNLIKYNKYDAGQDIISNETILIPKKNSKIIKTNLFIEIPNGYVGLIWSKSGLSVKHKLEVGAGCIDSTYRGEVLVHLYNFGDKDYIISKGDKIAQLLTIPINLNEYKEVDELSETERNLDGFGSTGV